MLEEGLKGCPFERKLRDSKLRISESSQKISKENAAPEIPKPKINPKFRTNDPENLSNSHKSISPSNDPRKQANLLLENSVIKLSAKKDFDYQKKSVNRRSPVGSRENSNLKLKCGLDTKKSSEFKGNFDSGDHHMQSTMTFEPHSKDQPDTDTLLDTVQIRNGAKESPSPVKELIEMYIPSLGDDEVHDGFYHMKTEGDENRYAKSGGR